MTVYSHF